MTVSISNIWKSAANSIRHPGRDHEKKLHIGNTLRDLYFDEQIQSTEETFAELLAELDTAERAVNAQRRN